MDMEAAVDKEAARSRKKAARSRKEATVEGKRPWSRERGRAVDKEAAVEKKDRGLGKRPCG